jgi:redox-sensitive bicupin YhaK (pirin superfamily)
MEEKPPTPYQSARVQREPPPILRGKAVEPSFKRVPAASLWVSQPNPGPHKNPANTPHVWKDATNWLARRLHFCFEGEWKNGPTNFGPIRFLNDCVLQAQRSVGSKKEADLELLTLVLSGTLTCEGRALPPGSLLHSTCGTGHAVELRNASEDNTPVRYIQIGIAPRKFGAAPASQVVTVPEATGNGFERLLTLEQAADVFVGRGLKEHCEFEIAADKRAYLVVLRGRGRVFAENVEEGDGGTALGPIVLSIDIAEDALDLLVILVPQLKK